MSDLNHHMLARPKGTHEEFRRVGRHKRTGKFYWYGTKYAAVLKKAGRLSGSIKTSDIDDFRNWCQKKGLTAKTPVAETPAESIVRIARAEIGVREVPAGSNSGPRVRQYQKATSLFQWNRTGWPWCSAFVVWTCKQAKVKLPKGMDSASVYYFTEAARKAGRVVDRAPRKGDAVVLFGAGQHIGLVDHYDANSKTVFTIEGNTSSSGGSQANGGEVAAQARRLSQVIYTIQLV